MRTPLSRRCFPLAVVLLLAGCARSASVQTRARPDRSLISQTQLAEMGNITADQAVRRYQPRWLSTRPLRTLSVSREPLRVYFDGLYFGEFADLSRLRVDDLKQIRYVEAAQASMRYGDGHSRGAIVVLSRRANPGG